MKANEYPPIPPVPETPSAEIPIIVVEPKMELDADEAPMACAITLQPPAFPAPELATTTLEKTPSIAVPGPANRFGSWMWSFVTPIVLMISVFALVLWAVPLLLHHWRILDAQAEAEAIYTKRRAELKAEAEHADQRLDLLDKRVHLTSLGFREVARKVMPNVVNVANYREPTPRDLDLVEHNKLRLSYDSENDAKYVFQSVGSGLIYQSGVILTNYHVVRDAKRLRIVFPSERSIGVDFDVVASDPRTDLAVIRLPENLPAALKEEARQIAVFADSDKDVQVGDWTMAVGSPLDLRQTITQGIVSAKGRLLSLNEKHYVAELIQTTAAIHAGNSGGPLLDQTGRVIGINVAIATDNVAKQGIGIGFAIPSNTAKKIADLLIAKGEVPRGFLGIGMEELSGPKLKALKIDDGAIVVTDVMAGEVAAKAGIKAGDIVVLVNKHAIRRSQPVLHFRQMIVDLEPGAPVTLDTVRGEERRQVIVNLGKLPPHLR